MGGYIRGQVILCFIIGLSAFLAYLLIGLPYALVLGIIAGVMEAIPIFGPTLGAVPALLVALSVDPEEAILVVIATILIQTLENMFLLPRVMNKSIGVNPILILLSMVAFGSAFGFPGVLIALPLAAMLQFIINRIVTAPDSLSMESHPRAMNIQPLLEEGERLERIVSNISSNGSKSFNELPEVTQTEINTIVHELNQFLAQLKNEDEVA